ncbi:MAG: Dodecaprenyl-phosphate galacturonate synthase [Anaerolineae bacterium]|nr:Dodecaprenyl-phosphate galacturonate synthase [Anaerolineae bacterium]
MQKPYLSIVLPIYNEVESIPHLLEELVPVLDEIGHPFEILCVDDGSSDGSFDELVKLHQQDERVRVVRFRRNFGQTAAFAAGFDRADGELVITMDADLQNDPADIPKLLEKIDGGFDVVSGWRTERWKEGAASFITRKLPSMTANWLISTGTGVHLHDYGCALKAYRGDVVKSINLYGDLHRFIPAIASYYGVNVAEVPVKYRSRQFGRSKYGLGRITRVILDLLTVRFLLSYSTRPIQIFGLLGIGSFALGVLIGIYLSVMKLVTGIALSERPMLLLAILLVMIGVQFVTMGLLGELIVRTYHESQGKPIYTVRDELG